MADKQIIPYGADLNKKPDVLALIVIPLEVTPFAQINPTTPKPFSTH